MLYRELIKISITPPVADEMELWQIAGFLTGEEAGEAGARRPLVPPPTDPKDLLRARMAAARGEGPPPEAQAMDDGAVQQVVGVMTLG